MTPGMPTKVVLLTPPSRSAIASLVVDGPQAAEIVGARLQTLEGGSLANRAMDRIVVGRWTAGAGEELVVCRRTPQQIEIHCHGGSAAVAAMIHSLVDAGCHLVMWPEWIGQYEADRITFQARVALAQVRTFRAAAILLDQFHGALSREIHSARSALEERDLDRARHLLLAMQTHASTGLQLIQPWRVVLAGPPNVGKSSLLNALVGYRRAIVYDQAGTTRDVVTAMTALDGWPIELADTAGLCQSQDAVELAGISRTYEAIARADAVVLVFDGTEQDSVDHRRFRETWPHAICVYNKTDLQAYHCSAADAIRTSAVAGTGIDQLLAAIARRIVPNPPPPGAAVPFLREHADAVGGALCEIERQDFVAALRRLSDITGGSAGYLG